MQLEPANEEIYIPYWGGQWKIIPKRHFFDSKGFAKQRLRLLQALTHRSVHSAVFKGMIQLQDDSLVLHVWPGAWNLPSVDPHCLAAILHLQLAIPRKFHIEECTNPDSSPSGQLPYLTHEHHVITSLPGIVRYVAGLRLGGKNANNVPEHVIEPDLDASLSVKEKSQRVAWTAHIEANLGDLVANVFYSLNANWSGMTHPMLVLMLPNPQRYYVPGRIRETYRPRLTAAGLWDISGIEQEQKPSLHGMKKKTETNEKDKFVHVFAREKVLEQARSSLDKYSRLLGDKPFFYHDRPTTLDVILTAHILLLIDPPFPDLLLQTLLKESYPSLVTHARLVQAQASSAFGSIKRISPPAPMLQSLIPWPTFGGRKKTKTPEDIYFDRLRWGWMSLVTAAVVVAVVKSGIRMRFRFIPDEEDNE